MLNSRIEFNITDSKFRSFINLIKPYSEQCHIEKGSILTPQEDEVSFHLEGVLAIVITEPQIYLGYSFSGMPLGFINSTINNPYLSFVAETKVSTLKIKKPTLMKLLHDNPPPCFQDNHIIILRNFK